MIETIQTTYTEGKKSLESLLRDRAYAEVKERLFEKGINIDEVSDIDIETLVAAKVEDMMNGIQGFAKGTAFALAISLLVGV